MATTNTRPLRLRMQGVQKQYGAVRALRQVDFELIPGEVMALLGENGAGKSTLVKILAGLVRPDSGEVLVDGRHVTLESARRSQECGIAVVQQEFSAVPCLSVAENLVLGQAHAPAWQSPRKLGASARSLLAEVGLGHVHPSTLVESLSVAEVQLLEIARVLARDARIVVFDEPTAALSDADIERVLDVVRRLAAQGRSIIYVTHRLPEVFEIADRVTVIRNGRSLPSRAVRDLSVAEIVEMMLGREAETMFPARGSGAFTSTRLSVTRLACEGIATPVSFDLRAGEILGLAGQIGSGATDLVRALAGASLGVKGEVMLEGRRLPLRTRKSGIARGVAYCSGDRKKDGIFAGLTVQDNLASPWLSSVSRLGVISSRSKRSRSLDAARTFAVDTSRLLAPVGTLSGGNQQKVALGKWLGIEPVVLLVEEPTRGVDVGARAEIYAHLRGLCRNGMSMIVSSSDTAELYGLCDSIAAFYRGRMTDIRPHDQWTEQSLVQQVMHREAVA